MAATGDRCLAGAGRRRCRSRRPGNSLTTSKTTALEARKVARPEAVPADGWRGPLFRDGRAGGGDGRLSTTDGRSVHGLTISPTLPLEPQLRWRVAGRSFTVGPVPQRPFGGKPGRLRSSASTWPTCVIVPETGASYGGKRRAMRPSGAARLAKGGGRREDLGAAGVYLGLPAGGNKAGQAPWTKAGCLTTMK